nr:hypothetical protein [Tanacetum cinerariifolium]
MIKTRMKTPLPDQTEGQREGVMQRSKSAHAEEHDQKDDDMEDQSHQEFNTRHDDDECQWNPSSSPTPDHWHNPEGKPYPHDLSKPLPLILNEQVRQVIPLDYFINKDLEYLKGGSSSQKYTTSITNMKAADYGQVKWIEDKKFYGYASNMESKHDVYSRHMIIVVTILKIMNWFGRIVIQEHMEDLQLGVKSYQKKINLKKPDTYRLDLRRMAAYTAYPDTQGIIYEDEMNRKRLMRTDELYKFSAGTLNHIRTALNDVATGIEMGYLPKRK